MKNLLCVLAVLLLGVGRLAAEDDFEMASYQSVLQTLDSQDQELSELKTRLASLETQVPESPAPMAAQGPCSPMTCCTSCVARGGWFVGGGIYYLQPRWGSNPALASFTPNNASSVVQNFDFRGHVAPFAYAGYTGANGLGFRTQWFSYTNSTTGPSASPIGLVAPGLVTTPTVGFQSLFTAAAGSTLLTAAQLGVTAIDFEITKALGFGCGSYLISGGVRYAHIGQQYAAATTGPTGALTGLLTDGHNFNGLGPTLAAQARYPIPFAPNVGIYGRGRGSMLVGQQHDYIQSTVVGGAVRDSFSSSNQIVPVGELEIGVDWNRGYRSYGFFMQTGFVVQSWFGVGNSANSNLISTVAAPGASVTDTNNILGLYGVRGSAGVTF